MTHEPLFAFLYNIQGGQLLIVVLAIVLLFGTKRLPDIAKTFGKALNEFRKAASDVNKEIQQASAQPTTTTPAAQAEGEASQQKAEKNETAVV